MKNITITKHWLFILSLIPLLYSCTSEMEVTPMKKDIQELVFASGAIEWDDVYNVTAQTDGILKDVHFEIGTSFKAGEFMARIENATNITNEEAATEQLKISAENASNTAPLVLQLEQSIQFAEEKLKQDQLQVTRMEKLFANKGVSQIEFENAQLSQKSSNSNLQSLKKQLEQVKTQAKQNLINANAQYKNAIIQGTYNQVLAIEKGIVIKKLKSKGDYVRKGDVIAVIANQKAINAVLNVDEKSISKVKLGQKVFIRLNTNSEHVILGEISEILSAFDEQSQSFVCKAQFKSTLTHVLYGTQLEANILVGQKKNAVVIPRSYLGFGNLIQLKSEDRPRKIKTGIISSDYAEVTGGLKGNAILIPLKP